MQHDLLAYSSNCLSWDEASHMQAIPFRTLHYLGSKLRMLEFIRKVADEEDPRRGAICDLFSGTGSVSQYLSSHRRIVSVDIQEYSKVICSALLNPCTDEGIREYAKSLRASPVRKRIERALGPVVNYEKNIVELGRHGKLNAVCDFLENCSLYSAMETSIIRCEPDLSSALNLTIDNINNLEEIDFTASIYFGGVYYSFEQAAQIDVLLYEINSAPLKYQNTLMAALLSTASDLVNTVGKQFAQPIRPRKKNGEPKNGLINQLSRDRGLSVFDTFENWVSKYSNLKKLIEGHEVLCMDYKEALQNLPEDVSIVYADPPYTRDHYSRFYHGLETLSLQDKPKVSKTKIGGKLRLSRGLYRQKRHQSPFCIKSQAADAFRDLFRIVSEKNRILLLSYSPYDQNAKTHPRVMKLEELIALAKCYFNVIKTASPGAFSHSKLNHSEKHLEASKYGEIIIVCRN